MVEGEENKQMNGLLPSIRAEVAMFVLVLLGSVFIALGFVSTSAYHYAMGFPPALFPPQSALLGLMGFVYGIPAICLVAVTPLIGLVGWKAGKNTWFKIIIVERVKKNKNSSRGNADNSIYCRDGNGFLVSGNNWIFIKCHTGFFIQCDDCQC